ncbi:hypothetical protein [Nocardioides sp. AE5]|uniref:hypothetical protein n=1 Tax=Nocardioides sp. AE5 TaxID=2962573 RepID=UPI002881D1B1|nr:hypothetical protein [Nocardioides sp. AE5]MDT0201356.1 hypothetical protein [Nocardioides sp. AE5]
MMSIEVGAGGDIDIEAEEYLTPEGKTLSTPAARVWVKGNQSDRTLTASECRDLAAAATAAAEWLEANQ